MVEPTDDQVDDLARAWFSRDFEHDLPDEWERLEPYVRENYRTGARWMWQYVEGHRSPSPLPGDPGWDEHLLARLAER